MNAALGAGPVAGLAMASPRQPSPRASAVVQDAAYWASLHPEMTTPGARPFGSISVALTPLREALAASRVGSGAIRQHIANHVRLTGKVAYGHTLYEDLTPSSLNLNSFLQSEEIVAALEEEGHPDDFHHLRTKLFFLYLRVIRDRRPWNCIPRAEAMLAKLGTHAGDPWSCFVGALGEAGELDAAITALLRLHGSTLVEHVVLLDACTDLGDWPRGRRVLESMLATHDHVAAFTATRSLQAYARGVADAGDPVTAREVCAAIVRGNGVVDLPTTTAVAASLHAAGDVSSAVDMYTTAATDVGGTPFRVHRPTGAVMLPSLSHNTTWVALGVEHPEDASQCPVLDVTGMSPGAAVVATLACLQSVRRGPAESVPWMHGPLYLVSGDVGANVGAVTAESGEARSGEEAGETLDAVVTLLNHGLGPLSPPCARVRPTIARVDRSHLVAWSPIGPDNMGAGDGTVSRATRPRALRDNS